jgi:hypothetical protein
MGEGTQTRGRPRGAGGAYGIHENEGGLPNARLASFYHLRRTVDLTSKDGMKFYFSFLSLQ